MRKGIRELAVLAGLVLALAPAARCEQPVILENAQLRVSFSPENATVLEVHQKQRNASYLGSSKQAGWFRIQLPLPYWEGHAVRSRDLQGLSVKKRGPDLVAFHATRLRSEEGDYEIITTLIFRVERDNLVCQLTLRNQSEEAIDRVSFPILDVPAALDSSEILLMPYSSWPLRSLFSENDIRTAHNPFDSLDPLGIRAWFFSDPKIPIKGIDYPGSLPTAWLTYVSEGRGIGFDVRDQEFQYQKFLMERRLFRDQKAREANRRDYELSWNWYPLVRPGETWKSPEIYIKFDNGDWHAIARQHREWLKTWIRRPKPPKLFQASIGWISRRVASFNEIPELAKQGVEVGAPYLILYGWSNIGPAGMSYGNYPRSELGGVESLKRNLRAARELGSYPLAWFNGTLSVETNLEHFQMGKRWIAMDRWGGELVGGKWSFFEPFQIVTSPNYDVWLQFDPSTGVRNFLLDTIRRIIEDYHFAGFQMDQGYKNFLSYRPENRRPEVAFSQGYGEFYADAQVIVKKANPNGIIVGENVSEHMGQYVDSIWIFEGGRLDVPLLSRLRYSLPWLTVPTRAIVTDRGHANRAFIMNAPLDIFDDLTRHSEYARHLKQLYALKKTVAHYFYEGEFSDEEGFTVLPSAAPDVLAKSYRDPAQQSTAVMIANTSGTTKETIVRTNLETSPRRVHHYYLDGRVKIADPSPSIHLSLPAYDVQILFFDAR